MPVDKEGNMIDFDAVCYDKNDKQHRQQAESRKKNRKWSLTFKKDGRNLKKRNTQQ